MCYIYCENESVNPNRENGQLDCFWWLNKRQKHKVKLRLKSQSLDTFKQSLASCFQQASAIFKITK